MAGTLIANTINTDTGLFSTNNAYSGIAKAWVQFGGGTTYTAGAINGSFNVSSVTVNGTGDYTINFATAMTNANYCALANSSCNSAGANIAGVQIFGYSGANFQAPTTSSYRFGITNSAYSANNSNLICTAVFGN